MPPEFTTSKLDKISQLQGADAVVIFGKTRAGKSAFINDVYGREILPSTDSMTSDTTTISYVDEKVQIGNHAIRLVDTIGLGGSGHKDDTIHLARTWINIFRNEDPAAALHPTVKGFMYFIDVSDVAGLNQDNQENLQFFKSLIGTDILDSVFFVTTRWAPAEPKSGRRKHEKYFQQWKDRLNEEFPGAHLVRLDDKMPRPTDEDLREDDPDISEDEILEAKAAYSDNLKALLKDVLSHPATAPTQTEAEIHGDNGAGKSLADTSLGGFAKAKIDKTATALTDAGNPDEAKRLQNAACVFSRMKVVDAGTITFTIQTVHKRGVIVSLPFGTSIRECKSHVKKTYPLNKEDQYYSDLPAAMPEVNDNKGWFKVSYEIYPDEFQIRDGCTLLLRTDTYLGRNEITEETKRLTNTYGKDILGTFGTVPTGMVRGVTNLAIAAISSVNGDIYRQQIRMWKRTARVVVENTEKRGVVAGFLSGSFNIVARCSFDGVSGNDLQDRNAERVYESIGA